MKTRNNTSYYMKIKIITVMSIIFFSIHNIIVIFNEKNRKKSQ